ncbi:malignant T-cell-amplified sequence 1-like [Anneissia japonica]|uniref:malignant T-cell-amplified sequence 1-like n=1 Tax=Anneissia japonica TaxID=1529436 RepID=UPI0014257CF0|nr:malignant T-cell-amplified sequence 1-like [Anneissia japonica]
MFKKFVAKDNISGTTQVKSSVARNIRSTLVENYPPIAPYIDQIIPKKEPLILVKCHDHIELVALGHQVIFFRDKAGVFMPTLKLLHKYPMMLPHQQVDQGAIRFVLSGANIMCPGLTSPGANMQDCEKDKIVAIMAEGKEHAIAIGLMKMSSDDIKTVNKGVGVENLHYVNDGLWQMKNIK